MDETRSEMAVSKAFATLCDLSANLLAVVLNIPHGLRQAHVC